MKTGSPGTEGTLFADDAAILKHLDKIDMTKKNPKFLRGAEK